MEKRKLEEFNTNYRDLVKKIESLSKDDAVYLSGVLIDNIEPPIDAVDHLHNNLFHVISTYLRRKFNVVEDDSIPF